MRSRTRCSRVSLAAFSCSVAAKSSQSRRSRVWLTSSRRCFSASISRTNSALPMTPRRVGTYWRTGPRPRRRTAIETSPSSCRTRPRRSRGAFPRRRCGSRRSGGARHARQRREGRLVRFIAKAGRTVQQSGRLGAQRAGAPSGNFEALSPSSSKRARAETEAPRPGPSASARRARQATSDDRERAGGATARGAANRVTCSCFMRRSNSSRSRRTSRSPSPSGLLLIFVHREGIRGRRSGLEPLSV